MRTRVAICCIFSFLMALGASAGGQEESPKAQEEKENKTHVFISGLFNAQTFSFTDQRSLSLYIEEGAYRGDWSSQTGPAFGFGAMRDIAAGLSVGAAVEILSATPSERFEARLPHPFFFKQHRVIEGEGGALSYDERAIHVLVGYTRSAGPVVVAISGGPSYFLTSTELVEDFTFSETYPYDEAALLSVERKTYDANKIGFSVGGWVGYRVLTHLAVGADLRFSRAKPTFTTSAGNEIEFDAGGARLGAGVRLLF